MGPVHISQRYTLQRLVVLSKKQPWLLSTHPSDCQKIESPSHVVVPARLVDRSLCVKSRYVHFTYLLKLYNLTVIVRRHFSDQERKLLSHIDAHGKLLGEIGVAVSVGEDAIHNPPRATQRRGAGLDSWQRHNGIGSYHLHLAQLLLTHLTCASK
jgi:hypothetical protein